MTIHQKYLLMQLGSNWTLNIYQFTPFWPLKRTASLSRQTHPLTPTHHLSFFVTQFRAALFLRAAFEMPSFPRFIWPPLCVREINNQSISSDLRHHSPLKSHTHSSGWCFFSAPLYKIFLFLSLLHPIYNKRILQSENSNVLGSFSRRAHFICTHTAYKKFVRIFFFLVWLQHLKWAFLFACGRCVSLQNSARVRWCMAAAAAAARVPS